MRKVPMHAGLSVRGPLCPPPPPGWSFLHIFDFARVTGVIELDNT